MTDTRSQVIHRADYTPPPFLIDTVHLNFDLVPDRTVVTNRMTIRRNPKAASAGQSLQLAGEQIELLSVALDGQPVTDFRRTDSSLIIEGMPERGTLEIVTASRPADNTSLMGLYVSNGNFFTQCEAEGFRKITYFLDRPDVMATYTVQLNAARDAYPVLLSNGNLVEEGALEGGRHFAVWHDPFAKPCYLFALVAGKLVALEEEITSGSGARKLLQVWVEPHDLPKTRHAMDSLIRAIRWDEARFGLELDLDRFMIVAVGDFNMGAMENKGLNIFNTKYVLADAQTATDADFSNIEAVVGHEYFHNWTGNRVTCRDWFQLSLKEGLTVFRDQEFSADMAAEEAGGSADGTSSSHATKRIEDVRLLRQVQFAEDAGPMAHPVRPDSYVEINNFYTVTIYEKGAEVVRLYQTLFGRDGFRKGMDLYFERHDGQAVTCDDFRQAMADANDRDLTQFERWYSEAGTPRIRVTTAYDAAAHTFDLTLEQTHGNPPTTGVDAPLWIPFAVGLLGADGRDLPLQLADDASRPAKPATAAAAAGAITRVVDLRERRQTFRFTDVSEAPLPSLLRNFSAPVIVDYDYSDAQLTFLLAHDSDPFNRWEAGQRLATRALLKLARQAASDAPLLFDAAIAEAFGQVLRDTSLAPAYREQVLTLPSEAYLIELMDEADPAAVHRARRFMRARLASALRADWLAAIKANATPAPYRPTAGDAGRRGLKNLALAYLAELAQHNEDDANDFNDTIATTIARDQYQLADNMTDRLAALNTLVQAGGDAATEALADFYHRFEGDALVIDKWFALQAMQAPHDGVPTIEAVRALMQHPAFQLRNPNRARSLIFSFCSGNPAQFHAADGSGHAFWAEQVLALDALNPQVAARLARSLERWRKFKPALRDSMHAALQQVATRAKSKDVLEVVGKALA